MKLTQEQRACDRIEEIERAAVGRANEIDTLNAQNRILERENARLRAAFEQACETAAMLANRAEMLP